MPGVMREPTQFDHLQSDVEVLEHIQDVEITDEQGTRHVRDERIELAETGEEFRRIVFADVDSEELAYSDNVVVRIRSCRSDEYLHSSHNDRDSLSGAQAVHEYRELPLQIAERRPLRAVLYIDRVCVSRVVPGTPPTPWWRAGSSMYCLWRRYNPRHHYY